MADDGRMHWEHLTSVVWFAKTEKIISIAVRMNQGENGLQFNQLVFLEHPYWILLY